MDIRRIAIGDGTLSYTDVGEGAPLVLVHGQLCDLRYWAPQQALSRSLRVVSVSLRHCWPDRCEPDADYTTDRHARDLAAFIDALGLGKVDLCGHSRGGYVALRVAERSPDRLRSLVVMEGGPVENGATEPSYVLDRAMPEIVAHIERGETDRGLEIFFELVQAKGAWQRTPESFRTMARDNAMTLVAQARLEPHRVPIGIEAVRRMTMPTLLVGGERSPSTFAQTLDQLAANLPASQRVTIPSASHAMNLERPQRFNEALRQFLASR